MTDAAEEFPLPEVVRRAPSPLNGERAGVRGEASQSPHESGEAMERGAARCGEGAAFLKDSIVATRLSAARREFRGLKPTAAIMASRCEAGGGEQLALMKLEES